MSPNAPAVSNGPKDGSASREDSGEAAQDAAESGRLVEAEDVPTLGLCRQMCLCSGLMASDGGLVFLQLAMVPCLQTLGVPVSLVTVAGVISGALDLMALPLLGWVSDGGTNPRRRKAPAVVLSALVFVLGYSLVIAGCSLRIRIADRHYSPDTGLDSPVNLSLRAGVFSEPYRDSLAPPAPHYTRHNNNNNNTSTFNTSSPTSDSWRSPDGAKFSGHSSPDSQPSARNASRRSESAEWMADPLGMGIPLAGLLGILGFVFMDMGNDFNNSCQRSYILTCSPKSQHNSLFVVGVLMSAVGGCVAAILGVLDIAALLINDSNLDAVPTKTLLQSAFFLVFTLVCLVVTLCSAPPLASKSTPPSSPDTPTPAKLVERVGLNNGSPQVSVSSHHLRASSKQSMIDSNVSINNPHNERGDGALTPSSDPACQIPLLSKSGDSFSQQTDPENSLSVPQSRRQADLLQTMMQRPKSVESVRSAARSDISATNAGVARIKHPLSSSMGYITTAANDSLRDLRDVGNYGQEKRGGQGVSQDTAESAEHPPGLRCGRFSMKKSTLQMISVCTCMFFLAGAWQSFNICATDYLGKVVYGGNPDADRYSQSYADYEQGITTGSLGVLMLNVAYVAVNLLQKRILKLIGPKAEYLMVCGLQVGLLVTLQLTDHVMVFYTVAVVYGLFRSVMYTIPFMLANAICQQAVNTETAEGTAKVGTTMGLMTAMMPLSFVVVSTFTGPLIHATGDPASPLYYAIATTAMAALVFAFT